MNIDFATGFIWFASFLFSTTGHRGVAAAAALRLRRFPRYHGRQVPVSPASPGGRGPVGVLAGPAGTSLAEGWAIGWASCPYDPRWAERYPRRAAVMAA